MCINPLIAWMSEEKSKNGKFLMRIWDGYSAVPNGRMIYKLPCGKCFGCKDDVRKRWVSRLRLESQLHDASTFLTLTYNDKYLPEHPEKSAVQNFIKRLRNVGRDYGIPLPSLKYFFCAERGSKFGRPHYHALLFGVDMLRLEWQPYIATYNGEYPVWASKIVERLWKFGYNVVGSATTSSMRYVAKYVTKDCAEDDTFSLKSMNLGTGFLYDIERDGRKLNYRVKKHMRKHLQNGSIHIADGQDCKEIYLPSCFYKPLEKIDNEFYIDCKLMRSLSIPFEDSRQFLKRRNEFIAKYEDNKQKDKLKRIL